MNKLRNTIVNTLKQSTKDIKKNNDNNRAKKGKTRDSDSHNLVK